jgi:uncharacterized membrane protein YdbT with pleckstrin-like domain
MSAIRILLGENEEPVFETRQHWFIPLTHLVTDLVLIVLLLAAANVVPSAFRQISPELVYFATAVLSISVALSAVAEMIRWRRAHAVVTDRRVLQTQGVVSISVIDIGLDKISETVIQQTWIGRLFGFGDLDILTTSLEGTVRVSSIERPQAMQAAIERARAQYDGYLGQDVVRVYEEPRDVRALLEQLATLRDRGILSSAEFEAKKRDLLSRI